MKTFSFLINTKGISCYLPSMGENRLPWSVCFPDLLVFVFFQFSSYPLVMSSFRHWILAPANWKNDIKINFPEI